MKDFLSVIRSSQLFSGVTETELTAVLACLDAKTTSFPKEAYLMHTGDTAEAIGFVLSGNVLTVQEDIWGTVIFCPMRDRGRHLLPHLPVRRVPC